MRFLLVDDHPIVRGGVAQLLLKEYPTAIIDEAGSAAQALESLRTNRHDLILLDLSLPDASGLDGLERLKRQRPDVPVLVVSMYEEDHYASRALKAGAAGYLHKQRAATEIIQAVRRVIAQGCYLSEAYAMRLAMAGLRGEDRAPHERLTAQEFRILCLIGSGNPASQIAKQLTRSVKTVSSHRANILQKMSMKSNAELVHYCIRIGLVR